METGSRSWEAGQGWGEKNDPYLTLLSERAQGKLPEMESSKALARRVSQSLKANERILDVGCAVGHYYVSLKKQIAFDFDYVGVDFTEPYIQEAQRVFQDTPLTDFQVGDIFDLPFDDQSFDMVYSCNVLLHLPSIAIPLKELCRVARRKVIIRSLIGERSFRIQDIIGSGDEFTQDGQPHNFHYFNIYSQDYIAHLLDSLPRVKSWAVELDQDYNPENIKEHDASVDAKDTTTILGDYQVNGYIISPWSFLEIELDG